MGGHWWRIMIDQSSHWRRCFAALGLLAASGAAVVSVAPSPVSGQPAPNTDSAQNPPTSRPKNPSDRLEQSEGVIQPPRDVDPKMQVKPPPTEGGKTPV